MTATFPLLMLAEGRRPRPRKAPRVVVNELRLHVAIVQLLRLSAAAGWRFWHTPNGELRDRRTAAKLKAMGVAAGVADLVLVSPHDGRAHFLEFKGTGGRLSEAQEEWRVWAIRHGIPFSVVASVDEAVAVLRHWGALRAPGGAA